MDSRNSKEIRIGLETLGMNIGGGIAIAGFCIMLGLIFM